MEILLFVLTYNFFINSGEEKNGQIVNGEIKKIDDNDHDDQHDYYSSTKVVVIALSSAAAGVFAVLGILGTLWYRRLRRNEVTTKESDVSGVDNNAYVVNTMVPEDKTIKAPSE